MAFNFIDFIVGNLPNYFLEEDTYKDTDNKGLFERYMGMYGGYIDEELYPQINNYLNIIDASICDSKFLNHISDVLGNPPDVFKNEAQYRNLLSYIVSVYKIKGTKRAYELFFSILGFNIEIEEVEPVNAEYLYDNEGEYDKGDPLSVYDQTLCAPCSVYNIKFYFSDSSIELTDINILSLLDAAIKFNEPINATLGSLTMALFIEDTIDLDIIDEGVIITPETVELYDTGNLYDDNEEVPDYPGLKITFQNLGLSATALGISDIFDVNQWTTALDDRAGGGTLMGNYDTLNVYSNSIWLESSGMVYPKILHLSNLNITEVFIPEDHKEGLERIWLDNNLLTDFQQGEFITDGILKEILLNDNFLTKFNLVSEFPASFDKLVLSNNQIEEFVPNYLTNTFSFEFDNNNFPNELINETLIKLADLSPTGKTYLLNGPNMGIPFGDGLTSKDELISLGNTVITN